MKTKSPLGAKNDSRFFSSSKRCIAAMALALLASPANAALIEISFTATIQPSVGGIELDASGFIVLDNSVPIEVEGGFTFGAITSGFITTSDGFADAANPDDIFTSVTANERFIGGTSFTTIDLIAGLEGGGIFVVASQTQALVAGDSIYDVLAPGADLDDFAPFVPTDPYPTALFFGNGLDGLVYSGGFNSLSVTNVTAVPVLGTHLLILIAVPLLALSRRSARRR